MYKIMLLILALTLVVILASVIVMFANGYYLAAIGTIAVTAISPAVALLIEGIAK